MTRDQTVCENKSATFISAINLSARSGVLVSLSVLVYGCKGSFSGERVCVQAHITKQFKAHYNLKSP